MATRIAVVEYDRSDRDWNLFQFDRDGRFVCRTSHIERDDAVLFAGREGVTVLLDSHDAVKTFVQRRQERDARRAARRGAVA